jgi:alkanesulfonate monooxygenase SsuD/methylene tetrahydromethanopterin reductase-like flavin-dependent oxidoreductase (luciferase family)
LAELALAAESMGAAAILVADEGTDRDLFVTLAALAQRTRRLLLVGAVTNPHSRHPVALAAAYASVAELAPDRLIAGFGTGGSRVFHPMGLQPARPYSALVECLAVVQALWRGETVSHAGEFVVREARLDWSPGSLPVAIAGRGPRVERLAAERASWVLLAGRAVSSVPELIARLRTLGVSARGKPPAIAWNPVAAWTEPLRDELRAHLAYMVVDMPASERLALGIDEDLAARLRQAIAVGGPSASAGLIPDEVMERYAILGSREVVVARLGSAMRELGPELVVFDVPEYSVTAVQQVASLAMDAGAAIFHNREDLYGLDSHHQS